MNMTKILGLMFAAFVGAVVLVGGCLYSGYNKAIRLDEDVKSAWAQVENQLQRRYELIPNLVETVKGVAGHEREVFTRLAEARKAYFQSEGKPVAERAKAASAYESVLSRLLVLRETYPELKANESFLKLQDELAGTENRLAVERKRYNDVVRDLNVFTRQLLGRLYCSLARVSEAEYFEVSEAARETPKVDFNTTDS